MDKKQWDDSQKRVLFGSEDLDNISTDSDSLASSQGWPPEGLGSNSPRGKPTFTAQERQGIQLLSPAARNRVLKLQKDLEEAQVESRYLRANPVTRPLVDTNQPRFTRTPVPRYNGSSDWEHYREVFEAIVISNGWDDLTAALQLLAHLDGEALNVALLVPEDQRRRPGVLMESVTAHYSSPGRLAQRRRQFDRMTRSPGEDPAAFAIALETLARRAFIDVDPGVRLQLVRDKFITGQQQLALRRHLDSMGPDTPMVDIVDKCCVWESHEEDIIGTENDRESGLSRPVYQVQPQVVADLREGTQEPDSNYSKLAGLTTRLRELVKEPQPGGSAPVNIAELLRQLLPQDDEARETDQALSETESTDNGVSGNVA